jgi:hypothetical protein
MTEPAEKVERVGCGTIVALAFVAFFWMLITLGAVLRSLTVGWPGLLRDEGALTLSAISLTLLVIVLVYRDEIIKPSMTPCPKCGEPTRRGQFAVWQFILVVCFFPLGLLALLAGRQPSVCSRCGRSW